jgi:multidrug resistance efflux pump
LEASLHPVSIVVIGLTPQSEDEIADAALLRTEGEIATAKNTQNRIEQKQKDMREDIESKNADTAAAHAAISEAYTN